MYLSSLSQYIPHPFLFPVSEWIPSFRCLQFHSRYVSWVGGYYATYMSSCFCSFTDGSDDSLPFLRFYEVGWRHLQEKWFDDFLWRDLTYFLLIVKNEVQKSIFNKKSHFLHVYCEFQLDNNCWPLVNKFCSFNRL